MTIYIKTRKNNKLQLNGNVLTGDTFPVKGYIKATLGGRWDADRKAWIVDVAQVERWLNVLGSEISTDNNPEAAPVAKTYTVKTTGKRDGSIIRNGVDGWCNKCHSYCYGDCSA